MAVHTRYYKDTAETEGGRFSSGEGMLRAGCTALLYESVPRR